MGFFSGLWNGVKHTLGNIYNSGTKALGSALWSGAKAVAPYLFPKFFSPEAVGARKGVSDMINRGLEFSFSGH